MNLSWCCKDAFILLALRTYPCTEEILGRFSIFSSVVFVVTLFVLRKKTVGSLVPLFQSESTCKCETILMEMTLIWMKMKLHAELIFIWKVSHLDSFWYRGKRDLGNGLYHWRVQETFGGTVISTIVFLNEEGKFLENFFVLIND